MTLDLSTLAGLPVDACWEVYALALVAPAVRPTPRIAFPEPMQILAVHAAEWVFEIEERLEETKNRWQVAPKAADDDTSKALRALGVTHEHLAVFAWNDDPHPLRRLVAAWNPGDRDAALFEYVLHPHDEGPLINDAGTVRGWLASTIRALFDPDPSRDLYVSTELAPQLRSILRDATVMREQLLAERTAETAALEAAAMSATDSEADAALARWENAASLLARVATLPAVWSRLFDDDEP